MKKKYTLTTELYSIPLDKDSFIVYAPLQRKALAVNHEGVNLVSALQNGSLEKPDQAARDFLNQLEKAGFVNGKPDIRPSIDLEASFQPTHATVSTTSNCNMRCVYCFARGGESITYLPWHIARSAVDLIVKNARAASNGEIGITF